MSLHPSRLNTFGKFTDKDSDNQGSDFKIISI